MTRLDGLWAQLERLGATVHRHGGLSTDEASAACAAETERLRVLTSPEGVEWWRRWCRSWEEAA